MKITRKQMKFKVGDRIRAYGVNDSEVLGWCERLVGTITKIQDYPPRIWMTPDDLMGEIMVIPQQCRLLKPKKKRCLLRWSRRLQRAKLS